MALRTSRRSRTPTAALIAVLLLLGGACSGGSDTGPEGESDSAQQTNGQEESTRSSPTTRQETTEETSSTEVTLDASPEPPGVVLRIEGAQKTAFSGICSIGGEDNVLSGRVPKRFAFDPEGRELSCRIEKRDSGNGDLRVILTANGTTRSVQQTNSRGSIINVSYRGN